MVQIHPDNLKSTRGQSNIPSLTAIDLYFQIPLQETKGQPVVRNEHQNFGSVSSFSEQFSQPSTTTNTQQQQQQMQQQEQQQLSSHNICEDLKSSCKIKVRFYHKNQIMI